MTENNSISKDFNFLSLLWFSIPTIIMMVFTSIYTTVDGIFVSQFVGTNALSAINIVYPFVFIIYGVGIMLGTGGSAIIATRMGEGKYDEARENFTLIVICGLVFSFVIAILGFVFRNGIVTILGANDALMEYCVDYFTFILVGLPALMLQLMFQSFFVASGKPHVGMAAIISAGIANIVLDYIFIVPFNMGIKGAAIATSIGYCIPAVTGLVFFSSKKSVLHFTKPKWNGMVLWYSCFNGSSEMVTNIAAGIIAFMFNIIMMHLLGEDGVAAITIVLYSQFLFTAIFLGFSEGVAPVISFNHGAGNTDRIKKIFKICITIIGGCSVLSIVFSLALMNDIAAIFAPVGSKAYELSIHGFPIFSMNYIFAGLSIYASAMFTVFSNGKVSAIISFLRTFAFIAVCLAIMPNIIGVDGVWLAVPVAEFLGFIISAVFLFKYRRRYGY